MIFGWSACLGFLWRQQEPQALPLLIRKFSSSHPSILHRVCKHALVLQLELGSIEGQTPFVMTELSNGLMMTTEQRPAERLSRGDEPLPEEGPDQMDDFWKRVGDQQALSPLPILKACRLLWLPWRSRAFFPNSALAVSRIKVAQNWATRESVTCRYQPVQLLTSY